MMAFSGARRLKVEPVFRFNGDRSDPALLLANFQDSEGQIISEKTCIDKDYRSNVQEGDI